MKMVTPEAALRSYRGNVENFAQAASFLLCVGEKMTPIMLVNAAPDDERRAFDQYAEAIDSTPFPHPMDQVVFSSEAWVRIEDEPCEAAVIYSVSSEGPWRLMAPFVRERPGKVEWHGEAFLSTPGNVDEPDARLFAALVDFVARSKAA